MHAEYDSAAKALQIDLEERRGRGGYDEDAGPGCTVGIVDGRVVGVEVLSPEPGVPELDAIAGTYGLDVEALRSAAAAALASPDRRVEISVADRAPA